MNTFRNIARQCARPARLAPLVALSSLVLLTGCAGLLPAGPKAPAAPPSPAAWQGNATAAASASSEIGEGLTASWARLVDPDLQALLQQGEAANLDIAQAALRLAQADNQARLGAFRLTPSASLSSSANRTLDPLRGEGASISRSSSVSASVAYEADLWGRLAALRTADAAQTRAAQADLQAARLLLRQRLADSYWQLAAAQGQVALTQAQLQLSRELLESTRLRVREGLLLPIELDRVAATLQQIEVRAADLQTTVAQQRMQLGLLLQQPPPGPLPQKPQLPPMLADGMPPPWRVDASPAQVLARRPDVRRARAAVDAALANARATQAQRYPTLSFNTSFSSGGGLMEWLVRPMASLAANLVVPLIDWRRLDLQGARANSELELAALALRDTVAAALVEVENALIEEQRLKLQLQANATQLREVRAAEELAVLRMSVGTIARADLLQSRIARLEAEQNRWQLHLRVWLNRSLLARALAVG